MGTGKKPLYPQGARKENEKEAVRVAEARPRHVKIRQKRVNVDLETVLGNTSAHSNSMAFNTRTKCFAYICGACVVLIDPNKKKEARRVEQVFVVGRSSRRVNCLCFSRCGRYLAVGEVN